MRQSCKNVDEILWKNGKLITLTNADYCLLSKILVKRLSKKAELLVHQSQSTVVPRKKMSDFLIVLIYRDRIGQRRGYIV